MFSSDRRFLTAVKTPLLPGFDPEAALLNLLSTTDGLRLNARMIPLEDNFSDILGKAQRGLKLASVSLANASLLRGVMFSSGAPEVPLLREGCHPG